MELSGETVIRANREDVWRALNDPDVLSHCIPGCEEVRQISPTETHVRLRLKLGPVRARFVGKILMSEVRPNDGCVMNFEGSGGVAGFAKGSSTVKLDDDPTDAAASTRLHYTAQAAIGGKLGQIGGRMIDASAKQMADQFFQAFGDRLRSPSHAAGEPATEAVPAAATSSVEASSPSRPPALPVLAAPSRAAASEAPARDALGGESVRILWFGLGAAATALGFCIAALLIR